MLVNNSVAKLSLTRIVVTRNLYESPVSLEGEYRKKKVFHVLITECNESDMLMILRHAHLCAIIAVKL